MDRGEITMFKVQLVVCRIDDQEYGLELGSVKEILRAKKFKITHVPNLPPVIEGVINLRGKISYIYNARKRFHCADQPVDEETKIIVIPLEDVTVGLLVDEVTDILDLAEEEINIAPDFIAGIDGRYIKGIGKVGERLIIILDAARVLTEEERDYVSQGMETQMAAPAE